MGDQRNILSKGVAGSDLRFHETTVDALWRIEPWVGRRSEEASWKAITIDGTNMMVVGLEKEMEKK